MAVALRLAIRLVGITNSDRFTTDATSIDLRFLVVADGDTFAFPVAVFVVLSGGFFIFSFPFPFVDDVLAFASSCRCCLLSLSSLLDSSSDEEDDEELELLLLTRFLSIVRVFADDDADVVGLCRTTLFS